MQQFWRTFLSSPVTWHAAVLENISVKFGDLACSSSGEQVKNVAPKDSTYQQNIYLSF
jgi:hypothetical protein